MARLGIDVSGVRDPFATLPEGNYRLKVVGVETRKSQNNEAMISLQYEVIGGEYAGRKLFNVAMLEGKGKDGGLYTIHCHALIAGDNPHDPDPETWLNSEFEAEVTEGVNKQGKKQNNVTPLVDMDAAYPAA